MLCSNVFYATCALERPPCKRPLPTALTLFATGQSNAWLPMHFTLSRNRTCDSGPFRSCRGDWRGGRCLVPAPGLTGPTGWGLARPAAAATSAPGLGLSLPHLHRDWAHPRHICAGTAHALQVRRGPRRRAPQHTHVHRGPGRRGGRGYRVRRGLQRDWAHPAHICAGTGLTPPTSAPGLGAPRPHLRRDWAHLSHVGTGTGLGLPRVGCGRSRRVFGPHAVPTWLLRRASRTHVEYLLTA